MLRNLHRGGVCGRRKGILAFVCKVILLILCSVWPVFVCVFACFCFGCCAGPLGKVAGRGTRCEGGCRSGGRRKVSNFGDHRRKGWDEFCVTVFFD